MSGFESAIRNALLRVPNTRPEARERIYAAARASLERNLDRLKAEPLESERQRKQLEATIVSIEAEQSSGGASAVRATTQPEARVTAPMPARPDTSVADPAIPQSRSKAEPLGGPGIGGAAVAAPAPERSSLAPAPPPSAFSARPDEGAAKRDAAPAPASSPIPPATKPVERNPVEMPPPDEMPSSGRTQRQPTERELDQLRSIEVDTTVPDARGAPPIDVSVAGVARRPARPSSDTGVAPTRTDRAQEVSAGAITVGPAEDDVTVVESGPPNTANSTPAVLPAVQPAEDNSRKARSRRSSRNKSGSASARKAGAAKRKPAKAKAKRGRGIARILSLLLLVGVGVLGYSWLESAGLLTERDRPRTAVTTVPPIDRSSSTTTNDWIDVAEGLEADGEVERIEADGGSLLRITGPTTVRIDADSLREVGDNARFAVAMRAPTSGAREVAVTCDLAGEGCGRKRFPIPRETDERLFEARIGAAGPATLTFDPSVSGNGGAFDLLGIRATAAEQ